MIKGFYALGALCLLVGCQSTDKSNNQDLNPPLIMNSQANTNYDSIFDEPVEEDDEKYTAYFYDSRGKRFLTERTTGNRIDNTTKRLIDKTLKQAFSKLPYIPEEINIALEVSAPYNYKDEVLFTAEEYIVQSPNLTIQAQADETEQVIGKILKRELDPFYDDNSGQFDDIARASDLILYILVTEKDNKVIIKSSVLNKTGQIMGVKSASINLQVSALNTSGFVTVEVPMVASNETKSFELMKAAVNQEQLYGVGSKVISAANMSLDQANAYCTKHNMLLTSPYVFEFARRKGEIDRPNGLAHQELIAALDSEETDYDFYRDGDYLELEEDDQSNHFLVFDWNSEIYSIVSNSYSSEKMTFRCYKQ